MLIRTGWFRSNRQRNFDTNISSPSYSMDSCELSRFQCVLHVLCDVVNDTRTGAAHRNTAAIVIRCLATAGAVEPLSCRRQIDLGTAERCVLVKSLALCCCRRSLSFAETELWRNRFVKLWFAWLFCPHARAQDTSRTRSRPRFPFRLIEKVFSMEPEVQGACSLSLARAPVANSSVSVTQISEILCNHRISAFKRIYFEASLRGKLLTFGCFSAC